MKKLLSALLAAVLLTAPCASGVSAAGEYPSAFWSVNDAYSAAMDSGDDEGIAYYARQTVPLFDGRWDDIAVDILSSRWYEMARALERLGRYDEAADAYLASIPYNEIKGYTDCVIYAERKIAAFRSQLDVYQKFDGTVLDYNAINEPDMGVLFGLPNDSSTASTVTDTSAVLIYQSYGDDLLPFNTTEAKKAAKAGKAIEYALNLPGEGSQLADVIKNAKKNILPIIQMLAKLDTPVFFRFAAEMDVWVDPADPAQYIEAFRTVSKLVHDNSDNIAVVWSPNCVTGPYVNVHDYYPGDAYVDWVGVSLYLNRYFRNGELPADEESFHAHVFFAEDAANPVVILKDFVDTYGDRKPIMISESGASHTIRDRKPSDYTSWAAEHLRMIYGYLPMVYPQVKAIYHFDKVMPDEYADFALSDNRTLKQVYRDVTRSDMLIHSAADQSAGCAYRKIDYMADAPLGETEFAVYANYFGEYSLTVTYALDGVNIGSTSELPYRMPVDLSRFGGGLHTLSVTVRASDGRLLGSSDRLINVTDPYEGLITNGSLTLPRRVSQTQLAMIRQIAEKNGASFESGSGTVTIVIPSDKGGRIRETSVFPF